MKDTPWRAFYRQRHNASVRGIAFSLTFEQWWALWEPHWGERGRKGHEKCMCRTGDQGAYEAGNVRIDTNRANHQEFLANLANGSLRRKIKTETPEQKRERLLTSRYDKAAKKWLEGVDTASSSGI